MIPTADGTVELHALALALGSVQPPCRTDPDRWFDDTAAAARRCLDDCHAQPQCHAYALTVRPQHGVWAGTDYEHTHRKERTA